VSYSHPLFISDCSKRSSSKAAGTKDTAGDPLRYVEDVFKPRTKLAVVSSSLKNKSLHPYAQGRRLKKLRGTTLI
jgi:hypothetical protein